MPTYTLELFRVLEFTDDIGLNTYPIFEDGYRETLNGFIIRRYNTREIGRETIDSFRYAMNTRMHEIMPYFNKLYLAEQMEYDPLRTIDIRTVTRDSGVSESASETSGETETEQRSGSRAVTSNTPQTMLAGRGDYASSAADTTSTSASDGATSERASVESNDEREGESTTQGYQGAPAALLNEYRQSLINVNVLVLNELEDLFMGVWDNGDDYLTNYPFTRM